MATHTLGIHQSTYDAVFQHPIARNLQWRDVRSMLTTLADEVTEEHNGNFKFSRNGQTLVVHPPQHKDFSDVQELMRLRQFLERSDATPAPAAGDGTHLLVVIDHREARIYKTEMHGSVPTRITAVDPQGTNRHLHAVEEGATGQRKPEQRAFYEAVANALRGDEKILVFGSSTGSSSAMEYLSTELRKRHPDIADRVVGTVVVNAQHMTDDQLMAEARAFYGHPGSVGT